MLTIDNKTCDRCGTCIGVCRTNALTLLCDGLIIDDARCTRCGTCVDLCPFAALTLTRDPGPGPINKNDR